MKLTRPVIDNSEMDAVKEVLDSGYLTMGQKAEEFEDLVVEYTGARYAMATTSATTALHLAVVSLGIGKGDEVIMPSFTFPATANVVIQQGAVPVLADIELETFNISMESMKKCLSKRTKAIMPVHLFGLACDMDPIMEAANERQIPVVEDAACALGTIYKGKHCGAIGNIGCFSFHPRKIITTGEGGMVATNSPEIADRIRRLRNHGGIRVDDRFSFYEAGFNYRMSDINAAIGIAQMKKLDWIIKTRREIAEKITKGLAGVKGLILPREPSWARHTYQTYVMVLGEAIDRDLFIGKLRQKGVEAIIGTYALHLEKYIQGLCRYSEGKLPNAEKAFKKSLAIPLYPQMKEEDAMSLIDIIKETLEEF